MTPPSSTPGSEPAEVATYALAPALRVRLLGTGLVLAGLVVGLGALATALGAPGAVLSGLVVLAVLLVLALALLLGVRRWVVRLDALGYRVRGLRSTRVRAARWTDVLDLQTGQVRGGRVVQLRLRDGRTTVVPVAVLEGDAEAFVEALSQRLDRGHGYRRLR